MCREERSRHQQGIRIMRLQEQEQDLHAEAASWKLLASLHGSQDLTYPGGLSGIGLHGCGKAMPTKQVAASLIGSDLELNRYLPPHQLSLYSFQFRFVSRRALPIREVQNLLGSFLSKKIMADILLNLHPCFWIW